MARYKWNGAEFVDRASGEPMNKPYAGRIVMPTVISDIPEYPSPVTGKMITSRSERRDDLKRHGCVEYEPSMSPTKGKYRNPHFCKKRGLEVSEEFR